MKNSWCLYYTFGTALNPIGPKGSFKYYGFLTALYLQIVFCKSAPWPAHHLSDIAYKNYLPFMKNLRIVYSISLIICLQETHLILKSGVKNYHNQCAMKNTRDRIMHSTGVMSPFPSRMQFFMVSVVITIFPGLQSHYPKNGNHHYSFVQINCMFIILCKYICTK